jgi:hypothetical protein
VVAVVLVERGIGVPGGKGGESMSQWVLFLPCCCCVVDAAVAAVTLVQ